MERERVEDALALVLRIGDGVDGAHRFAHCAVDDELPSQERPVATPLSPGPPGLRNSEPMRCAGSVAGSRVSASEIFAPSGWA